MSHRPPFSTSQSSVPGRLNPSRDCSQVHGSAEGEPLFHNSLTRSRILRSARLYIVLRTARLTKLTDLKAAGQWKTAAQLNQETGFKSSRLQGKLLEEVLSGLPGFLERCWRWMPQPLLSPEFPPLSISTAVKKQVKGTGNEPLCRSC